MEWQLDARDRSRLELTPETTKEKAARVGRMFDEVAEDFGVPVIAEITACLQQAAKDGEVVRGRDIAALLEHKTTRAEFGRKVQAQCARLGIVTEHGFSLEAFTRRNFSDLAGKDTTPFATTRSEFLANGFDGMEVILADRPEDGEKPLLYAPKTASDAFSIPRIQSNDFHFGFWEIPGWIDKEKLADSPSPGARERLPALSAAIAAVIYHPQYGDGRRNAEGQLEVRHSDGTYKPITGDWLTSHKGLGFRDVEKSGGTLARTQTALEKYCPELFTYDLLRETDLAPSTHLTKERSTSVIPQNGMLSLHGVKHYVGRNLAGRHVRVESFGDHQHVIVLDEDGVLTPVTTIESFTKNDGRLQHYDNGKGSIIRSAPAALSKPIPFTMTNEHADPAVDKTLTQFTSWIALNNRLRRNNVSLDTALTQDARRHIRDHIAELAPLTEQIAALANDTGDIGVQSIAEIADMPDIAKEYLRVASELRSPEAVTLAHAVFEAGSTRRRLLAEVESALQSGAMTAADGRVAKYELTRRVASAITAMEDIARTATLQHQPSLTTLTTDLSRKNTDFQLYAAVFRRVSKEGTLPIESLHGIEVREKHADELSAEELLAMKDILQTEPKNLREKKDGATDVRYYLLEHNSTLSDFVSFDHHHEDAPDGIYGDNFNMSPDLQSSGVGRSFLESVLRKESQRHTIYAHAAPNSGVLNMYLSFGMKVVGTDYETIGKNRVAWTKLRLTKTQ